MVGPSSGSSWQLYVATIYLYMLGTSTTLCCFKFWSCGCTLERILFLALAVAEINIKFETNIKKV